VARVRARQEATRMYPDPAAPMELWQLDYGQHLLVWSFRAYAVGRYHCPVIVREYGSACGALAREARVAVEVFAQQVEIQGRRPVSLSAPGCIDLTRDEQLLLAIFAAAQRGEEDRCLAHLTWLLATPPRPPVYPAAHVATQALALHGHWLGAMPQVQALGAIETPAPPEAERASAKMTRP